MAEKTPDGPLAGVRVIDLTRVLSGPFCTMILGDLGADVIKIETPGGDPVRVQGDIRAGRSTYFAAFNRNKRSVVLDLYSDKGKETLAHLIAEADVLVENFRPGTLAKMGFDAERLEALNPRLITTSVNGWGSGGPYADRPAFDFVVQAMSGFMSVNGEAGGAPMRTAPPLTDLIAGLYGALSIVAACYGRDAGRGPAAGQGQQTEVAMLSAITSMFAYLSAGYLAGGGVPERTGNDHPLVAPYGLFECADGEVAVAPSNDVILKRFLGAVSLSHLLEDERFATNEARFPRRPALKAIIDEAMRAETQEHWIAKLNKAGVPCGKVQPLDEALNDPQLHAQEMVIDVPHKAGDVVRMTGFPMKFSKTPSQIWRASPELGEHSDEVLSGVKPGGETE